jgi:hypothetical protein
MNVPAVLPCSSYQVQGPSQLYLFLMQWQSESIGDLNTKWCTVAECPSGIGNKC